MDYVSSHYRGNYLFLCNREINIEQELSTIETKLRKLMDDFSYAADIKQWLRNENIYYDLNKVDTKLNSIASEIKELESKKRQYKSELQEITTITGDIKN